MNTTIWFQSGNLELIRSKLSRYFLLLQFINKIWVTRTEWKTGNFTAPILPFQSYLAILPVYAPRWSSSLAIWQLTHPVQHQAAKASSQVSPSRPYWSRSFPRNIRRGMQGAMKDSTRYKTPLSPALLAFWQSRQQPQKVPQRPEKNILSRILWHCTTNKW